MLVFRYLGELVRTRSEQQQLFTWNYEDACYEKILKIPEPTTAQRQRMAKQTVVATACSKA
jgi:hypothetical protein